jgi:malonyl-CoA O-methyltransferase
MSDAHPTEQSSIDQAGVARAYDRWAAQYDTDRNATRDLDADVVRRAPLDVAGRSVLELGCGTGKNSEWLAARSRELVALDFSAGMLAVARERVRAPNTRFIEHDIRMPWPVPPGEIDVVVGNLVLEHVHHLGPVFAEAARVLTHSGQLFLCELHPYRQLRGGQAHFTDEDTQETVPVAAYVHSTSEYVNGALAAGFTLRELGEWLEPGAADGAPPRLLSLLFDRR